MQQTRIWWDDIAQREDQSRNSKHKQGYARMTLPYEKTRQETLSANKKMMGWHSPTRKPAKKQQWAQTRRWWDDIPQRENPPRNNSEHKQEDVGLTLPNEKIRQETTVSTNKKMTGWHYPTRKPAKKQQWAQTRRWRDDITQRENPPRNNSEHKQEDDGMTLPNEKTRQETTVSTNKKMTGWHYPT